MAATKIFPITATEVKALAYIANPEKTDNGRLIITSGCSTDPNQASRDFDEIRARGTGLHTVLSQHFIQSFSPGEITPEQALEVGREMCERFLKNEYQYFLAVHTDKSHIHLHCIFNNVNMWNGRTFETNENRRTTQKDRSYQKLRDLSDEICRKHNLSVIQHPETGKGKSHWEWDMNRQGLSWKAKLKYAIDQVIKESENFEDFLEKCKTQGIIADYNPDHKIDLKFMLAEQKERNPRAKLTRAKTLGWFYETKQIKSRIDLYKGVMTYVPRTKIRQTTKVQENKFVRDAIDRGNMKLASIAKNIIAEYGVEPENIRSAALAAYAHRGKLLSELNTLKTEIDDLKMQLKFLQKYRKLKAVHNELKTLSGRQAQKFRKEHSSELNDYQQCRQQILEWYPDKRIPIAEALEQKINALLQERSQKNIEFQTANQKSKDLANAQRTIEEFLRQERNTQEQNRRRKKNGDLE
ncbi:MAG: relaxase/mobilization nuclease domain-containing protein [Ruminococcus sp.]|nr:relaxase/mobilization nuclease domain-containing protein [Ruminococcus sp.]